MSLKAVHLIFVTVLTSLCFGTGAWKFRQYRETQVPGDLVWGIVAAMLGVLVIFYGVYFLKKLKNFSYL
jgi:hypothetical protein